jgi:hypothetical protein
MVAVAVVAPARVVAVMAAKSYRGPRPCSSSPRLRADRFHIHSLGPLGTFGTYTLSGTLRGALSSYRQPSGRLIILFVGTPRGTTCSFSWHFPRCLYYYVHGCSGAFIVLTLRFAAALALRLLVWCGGLSAPCAVVTLLVSVLCMHVIVNSLP